MVRIIPATTAIVELEDMTVGLLCFNHVYRVLGDRREAGRVKGYAQATLAANPGLAAKGVILPRLTAVHLPEYRIEDAGTQTKRLWDD